MTQCLSLGAHETPLVAIAALGVSATGLDPGRSCKAALAVVRAALNKSPGRGRFRSAMTSIH